MGKVCRACLEEKDESCFHKKLGGLASRCKKCASLAKTKKYAETDPEVRKRNRREYYEKNSDQIKKKVAGYRKRNPDKVKETHDNWRKANPDKVKEGRKAWLAKPGVEDQQKAHRKGYNERNRDRHAARDKEYRERVKSDPALRKKRRTTIRRWIRMRMRDPRHRIERSMRQRMFEVIRSGFKSARTMELVGCSSQELKEHLEKQFKPGMSWSNYGIDGWHIDHVKPCSGFDLSDPEQQRQCFHFSNLQPLWWHENLAKGAA